MMEIMGWIKAQTSLKLVDGHLLVGTSNEADPAVGQVQELFIP